MASTAVSELQTKTNTKDEKSPESLDFFDSCTEEQKEFFIEQYDDISDVRLEKLHCTSCDKHLGSNTLGSTYIHPILQVLQCESCFAFYNSGEFKTGDDGSELHCRWCGQGGQVFCCSNCPSVFCQKCIKRNLSKKVLTFINKSEDWACFRCDSRPLWKLQSKCWALNNYIKREIGASLKPGYTEERRQIACTDFSVCCSSRSSTNSKIKTETNEPVEEKNQSRKRRRNRLKSDKSTSSNDEKTQQAKRFCPGVPDLALIPTEPKPELESVKIQPEKSIFDVPNQEQDEVVCTPDIFPCFEENSNEPPPMTEIHELVPPPNQNGVDKAPKTKPRISVRAPETMMSSPDQPMFPTIVQNRPLLHPIPGPGLMANATPMTIHNLPMLRPGSNLIQLNDGRLLTLSNPNYPLQQNVVTIPVSHITTTMPPPPLIPQTQNTRSPGPLRATTFKPNNNRQVRYTMAVNQPTLTPTASTSNRTATVSAVPKVKPNPLADQTLSSLLQKKLKANPNINRVKLRKMPDWFHVNAQSCLVIARTFITQLMDLTTKAQQMQECSYDEIKNMHVQLSFLISAVIGKYKNNQLDLNLQLSEWTDALCNSMMSAAAAELAPVPLPVTTPSLVPITRTLPPPKPTISRKCPGPHIRKQYKDIFTKYANDKKLCMDAVVIVQKFRYHKSTNVFKVKPKYKPIIRTPNIDPNVIQTIDSESDDDDCAIIPGPDPLLIDLDSASENGDAPVANGNLDESGQISSADDVEEKEKSTSVSKNNGNTAVSEVETSEGNAENVVISKENTEMKEKVLVAQDKPKVSEEACQIKIIAVTSGESVPKDLNKTDKDSVDSNEIETISNEIETVLNATEQVLNETEQVSNDIEMISKDNGTVSEKASEGIKVLNETETLTNDNTAPVDSVEDKVASIETKKDTVKKEAAPGTKEAVPDTKEAIPAPKETVTVRNEAVPSTKEAAPSTKEVVPDTKEAIPASIEAVTVSNEPVAVAKEAAHVTKESVTVSKESGPAPKEAVTVPNEAVAVPNETVPAANEVIAVENKDSSNVNNDISNEPVKEKVVEKVSPEKQTDQIAVDHDKSIPDLNGDVTKTISSDMEGAVSAPPADELNNCEVATKHVLNNKEDEATPMDIADVNEIASDIPMDIPDCDNEAVNMDTSEPKMIKQ